MSDLPTCYRCKAQPCVCHDHQTVYAGDVLSVLPELPADHFHCVVTSPPYFALRSYLPADDPLKPLEIGSEPTPEAFIETMVRVFREVRRCLHPSGLAFINLGDGYGGDSGKHRGTAKRVDGGPPHDEPRTSGWKGQPGQLLNMPHRVAEALRADGWLWRQTIVWAKRSPMPESVRGWRWERCRVKVGSQKAPAAPAGWRSPTNPERKTRRDKDEEYTWTDWQPCPGCPKCSKHGGYVLRKGKGRCTTAHEYLFVMSKSPVYFWDSAAFVEVGTYPVGTKGAKASVARANEGGVNSRPPEYATYTGTRNPRSVWTLSSEPTSVPHFATFGSELVRRCLQAGTSDGGCCPACGEPWAPVVERPTPPPEVRTRTTQASDPQKQRGYNSGGVQYGSGQKLQDWLDAHPTTILGYRPTCECEVESAPCRVFDPFLGIGTTLQTAKQMGRHGVGIELNGDYLAHVEATINTRPRWWKRGHQVKKQAKSLSGQLSLF